jgi:hypothetical protein
MPQTDLGSERLDKHCRRTIWTVGVNLTFMSGLHSLELRYSGVDIMMLGSTLSLASTSAPTSTSTSMTEEACQNMTAKSPTWSKGRTEPQSAQTWMWMCFARHICFPVCMCLTYFSPTVLKISPFHSIPYRPIPSPPLLACMHQSVSHCKLLLCHSVAIKTITIHVYRGSYFHNYYNNLLI